MSLTECDSHSVTCIHVIDQSAFMSLTRSLRRGNSVGITHGGITQSQYFPKGPQSHRGLGSRGGITQSELHMAGSLSRNYTWRDHSVRITHGGITQSEYIPKAPSSPRCRSTWRDHSIRITRGGITQTELHVAGSLSLNISLKVPNPTGVSVHVAGSLSRNYIIIIIIIINVLLLSL